jgi:hypothetical protein
VSQIGDNIIRKVSLKYETQQAVGGSAITASLLSEFSVLPETYILSENSGVNYSPSVRFTLPIKFPFLTALDGAWTLGAWFKGTGNIIFILYANDGTTTLSTVTLAVNAAPYTLYTANIQVPTYTFTSALILGLQMRGGVSIQFNSTNISFIKSTAIPYSNTITANEYRYRTPLGTTSLSLLGTYAIIVGNAGASIFSPLPYSLAGLKLFINIYEYYVAPSCRFTVYDSTTYIDVTNTTSEWLYVSISGSPVSVATNRLYKLYPVTL